MLDTVTPQLLKSHASEEDVPPSIVCLGISTASSDAGVLGQINYNLFLIINHVQRIAVVQTACMHTPWAFVSCSFDFK
jgi:hypothetical protein